MYYDKLLLGGIGWTDDRQNIASLLSGHQDLTPNSDATRLHLHPPHHT